MKYFFMVTVLFVSIGAVAGPAGGFRGDPVNFETASTGQRDPGYLIIVKKIEDISPKRANYLVQDPVTGQEFILLISEDQIFVLVLLRDKKIYVTPKSTAGVEC